MLSQYLPLFFRAVDIFADLCDDNHHEGQIEKCWETKKAMLYQKMASKKHNGFICLYLYCLTERLCLMSSMFDMRNRHIHLLHNLPKKNINM